MATTTVQAAVKGRRNGIGGFYVGRVDAAVMRRWVSAHGLDLGLDIATAGSEEIALALALHFGKTVAMTDQVRCDNCNGISSSSEEACPFCGDEGEVDTESADEDEGDADEGDADDADEDEDEEDEDEEDEGDADEDEDEGDADADEDEDEGDADELVAAAAPVTAAKKPAAKKPAAKEEGDMGTNGAMTVAANGAMTGSAKALDKAVADVKRLLSDSHERYYEFAQKVLEIQTKQLWKLRRGDDGKAQKYKSWESFVLAELGMSVAHAWNAIETANHYKSAAEINEVGGKTKAALLLRVVPQEREKLKEKAKAGATKRELQKAVDESRKKYGSPKTSQQAKAGAKAGEKKKAAAEAKAAKSAERITVANITGSRAIKLYKKPASLKGLQWPPDTRATRIGDQPFGRLELQPGVVQYFSVVKRESGEWVLNVQTVRED